jgi:formamidopyrimidine-DNA glycosylase
MPELPDVEVLSRYVDATSLHRRIDDVHLGERLVTDVSPQTLREHLRGAELEETRRHGKHLFVRVDDDGWLRLHFGMTGTLRAGSGDDPDHTELRLDFADGGHLWFVDPRKFGEISWVRDVSGFVDDQDLGPDPLVDDVDRDQLAERLAGRRGSVKHTLMDQRTLAGMGNVYVDEVLFRVGIHPESATGALGDDRVDALHRALREVIDEAIADRADPERLPDDWLVTHREDGATCPRCGGTIRRLQVSGRSTYACADHQARLG